MAEKKATKKAATKRTAKKADPVADLEKAVKALRDAGYDVSVRIDRVNDNDESEGRYL